MKTSAIATILNPILEENLERENKTRIFENIQRGVKKGEKEGLEYASYCRAPSLEAFEKSETKVNMEKNDICTVMGEILNTKYPSMRFYVSKDERSTYQIAVTELPDVRDIGLGEEYQPFYRGFTTVAYFKIKQKKTNFGRCDHYFSENGRPEENMVVSEITVENDVDVIETIKKNIVDSYNAQKDKERRAAEKAEAFEAKLKELGITKEDFEDLKRLSA